MQVVTVRLHRLALQEFHSARRWYHERSSHTAVRFHNAIREALSGIEQNPEQAVADHDGMRWCKTKRFPYLLHYFIVNQYEVHVYAIAHERRRPGYWKRRLQLP